MKRVEMEKGSGNPYADLELADAGEMLIKAGLVDEIARIIEDRALTQVEAAKILGMTQPKLSGVLCGKFRGVSQAKLIACLNRLGRDVDIVVKKASRKAVGRTQVVMQ